MSQVSPDEVRQALITIFQQWGMPKSIRVDNGMPLGDPQRKLIPELALWLTAKNIEVLFNRPRRPTDNAKVERMQRTTKNWAHIESAKDVEDLALRLKKVCLIQRQKFKVCRLGNITRLEAFPDLVRNPRKYDAKQFDIQKAYERLAAWTFVRKVSSAGQLRIYHKIYKVDKEYYRQYVSIKFDPKGANWNIIDAQGNHIKTCEATNLKVRNIQNLTVGQRTLKK